MTKYKIVERETSTRYITYHVEADTEEKATEVVEDGFAFAVDEGEYEPWEWVIDEVIVIGEEE